MSNGTPAGLRNRPIAIAARAAIAGSLDLRNGSSCDGNVLRLRSSLPIWPKGELSDRLGVGAAMPRVGAACGDALTLVTGVDVGVGDGDGDGDGEAANRNASAPSALSAKIDRLIISGTLDDMVARAFEAAALDRLLGLPVILERFAATRMAKFAQRLCLDLPDALARDAEFLAHLFKRALVTVFQAEPQHEHLALALGEVLEHVAHLLFEHGHRCRLGRRDRVLVLDEVAEMAILFLADRRLERDRLLRDLHDLAHLVRRQRHLFGDLFNRRIAAKLLQQLP